MDKIPGTGDRPPPYVPINPPPANAYGAVYNQQPSAIPVHVEHGRTIPVVTIIPPNYTVLAIMATVCFFPLGLVALSLTRRSRESVLRGDTQTAYTEAIAARLISRLSFSIGSVIISAIIVTIVLSTYYYS